MNIVRRIPPPTQRAIQQFEDIIDVGTHGPIGALPGASGTPRLPGDATPGHVSRSGGSVASAASGVPSTLRAAGTAGKAGLRLLPLIGQLFGLYEIARLGHMATAGANNRARESRILSNQIGQQEFNNEQALSRERRLSEMIDTIDGIRSHTQQARQTNAVFTDAVLTELLDGQRPSLNQMAVTSMPSSGEIAAALGSL